MLAILAVALFVLMFHLLNGGIFQLVNHLIGQAVESLIDDGVVLFYQVATFFRCFADFLNQRNLGQQSGIELASECQSPSLTKEEIFLLWVLFRGEP